MAKIGEIIRNVRKERGLKQSDVASALEISQNALSKKESGKTTVTPAERKKLAKLFKLSEAEFEAMWRKSLTEDVTRTLGGPGIPVINRAPAGQVIDYEEYGVDSGQGMEYLDWGDVKDDLAFAVIVVGDSMSPGLVEGDRLILSWCDPYKKRPNGAQPEDGKVVFVRFTEESSRSGCTLARMYIEKDGRFRLSKDNTRYSAIVVDREEIAQLAVAIERRTKM